MLETLFVLAFVLILPALILAYIVRAYGQHASAYPSIGKRRYRPYGGKRETARRLQQLKRGIIRTN